MVDPNSPSNHGDTAGGDEFHRLSTLFLILSNRERRVALHILRDRRGERVEIRDLAEEIAASRASDGSVDPTKVELTLRHAHCPKLANAGIVEYDDQRGTIRYEGDSLLESGLELAETIIVE